MNGSPRRSSRTSRAERRSSACPRATRTGLTVDLRQRPGRGERHPYGDISHGVRGGPLPRCPPPSLLADGPCTCTLRLNTTSSLVDGTGSVSCYSAFVLHLC